MCVRGCATQQLTWLVGMSQKQTWQAISRPLAVLHAWPLGPAKQEGEMS
jgi:hypothetical protein